MSNKNKTIHIIGNKRGCYSRHLHPLRVFNNQLIDLGLNIKYYSNPFVSGIEDCDVLIFLEGNFGAMLPLKDLNQNSITDFLSKFLTQFQRVIWFDDHDSSGMLRTYIFPLVSSYAKAQLLKDTNYYQKDHLLGVLHRDYVIEKFGIKDLPRFKGKLLDSELTKLKLSWNLGLINWVYFNHNSPVIKTLFLKNSHSYNISYTTPNLSSRKLHVSYRASMAENLPTVHWWRLNTKNQLSDFFYKNPQYIMNAYDKISKKEYHNEMKNAIISPSPFGIGEICYRDFECFMNGSLLLKPRMDHMNTWPDLFVDGETYVAHEWDFNDFNDKLGSILDHPNNYEEIAREGQNRFHKCMTDGHAFAQYFLSVISA